jgi:hypothetical protein
MKRAAIALSLLTAVLVVPDARAEDVGLVFNRMTAKIGELPDIKGRKMGVGDIRLASGSLTQVSVYLADQLDVALTNASRTGGYQVIARSDLCQVIREYKLWVDDRFDPNLTAKLGKLGGADLLATGRVTELGEKLSMSIRLVDTASGQTVWADTQVLEDRELKKLAGRPTAGGGCAEPSEAAVPPAPTPSATVVPPAPAPPAPVASFAPLHVDVWADKGSYRIGDTIQFSVRVNRDAYLTLINIGTSGDVTVIFPNRFHPSHFVRAGQTVILPDPGWGFSFLVQGPPGFDQIKAVASEDPVPLVPGISGRSDEPAFRSLDTVQTRNIVTAIKSEAKKTGPGKMTQKVIAVEVRR